jgi:release factor glutamine methyltransferase
MLTILEAINLSADYLSKKGIEDPKVNAEILLCKVLDCKKINLYLNFDRPLADEELASYRTLLKRRGEREPLQYITGSVEFYGLRFKVNPTVLIPRPETELLVEAVINNYSGKQVSIIDIGTGSGNIAISIAFHLKEADITTVDSSIESIETAKLNEKLNLAKSMIRYINADVFSKSPEMMDNKYDVIVSNPPYISRQDFINLEPELRIYEPGIALTDNSDGFSFYKRILELSSDLLKEKGKIYFELGQGQAETVRNLMEVQFNNISIIKDYQRIDRVICGEKR